MLVGFESTGSKGVDEFVYGHYNALWRNLGTRLGLEEPARNSLGTQEMEVAARPEGSILGWVSHSSPQLAGLDVVVSVGKLLDGVQASCSGLTD